MAKQIVGLLAGAMLLAAPGASAEGQGGGRSASGANSGRCMGEVVAEFPDGTKQVFQSPAEFVSSYPASRMDLGEKMRQVVELSTALKLAGADWAKVTDCSNQEVQLPSGLPFDGDDVFVLAGRGNLKVVRMTAHGRPKSLLSGVRQITFYGRTQPEAAK